MAAPWFVPPPATRALTAAFAAAAFAVRPAPTVAVLAKLTTPTRLPFAITPLSAPSVSSSSLSMRPFAAAFRSTSLAPAMLPERSSTSTTSCGVPWIELSPTSLTVTVTSPLHGICSVPRDLLAVTVPLVAAAVPASAAATSIASATPAPTRTRNLLPSSQTFELMTLPLPQVAAPSATAGRVRPS